MASISGSVTIAGDPDDWIAVAWDAENHAYAGVAAVSGGAYEITGLTAGKAYVVGCRPKSGPVWAASRTTALNDYTIPTDPVSEPYLYKATAVSPKDPNFSSVALLLHMNGSNGGTTFTDVTGKTVSAYGNAQISTAQAKYGGASGYFDGDADYLLVPGVDLGAGAWTIEFYARITDISVAQALASQYITGPAGRWLFDLDSSKVRFHVNGLVGGNITITHSATLSNNTWHHIAATRNSSNEVTCWVDGVASTTYTRSGSMPSVNCCFGALNSAEPPTSGPPGFYAGYLDDVRLSAGVCRYTAGFTPPTAAFPDNGNAYTGASQPTWPTASGNTVVDQDVTWTNMGQLLDPLIAGPLIAV